MQNPNQRRVGDNPPVSQHIRQLHPRTFTNPSRPGALAAQRSYLFFLMSRRCLPPLMAYTMRSSAPRMASRAPAHGLGPTRRYCDGTAPRNHVASASCPRDVTSAQPHCRQSQVRPTEPKPLMTHLRVLDEERPKVRLAAEDVGDLVAVRDVVDLDRVALRRNVPLLHRVLLGLDVLVHGIGRRQAQLRKAPSNAAMAHHSRQ